MSAHLRLRETIARAVNDAKTRETYLDIDKTASRVAYFLGDDAPDFEEICRGLEREAIRSGVIVYTGDGVRAARVWANLERKP